MFTTNEDVGCNTSITTNIQTVTSDTTHIHVYVDPVITSDNLTHIEPFPEWPVTRSRWNWAWQMHVYGLGTIFSISVLFTLIILVLIRKRLLLVRHLLVLGVTLTSYGVFRGMFYLIDPHHTRGVLPMSVCLCLYYLPFPCLTSAFACILLVLMRLTRVQIGPRTVCSNRFIVCSMTVYILSTIIISTVISYHPSIKLLLLICQSFYVTSNLLLCFTYVYGGFKMTQFSKDSAKILKQISDMNKLKGGDAVSEGNRRLLSLNRVTRPRLNLIALDEGSISCVTESTASGSEDLEYLNEAFFKGEVNKFTFYNNVPHKRPKRPHNNNTKHSAVDSPSKGTEYELDISDDENPCSSVSVISGLSQARVLYTKDRHKYTHSGADTQSSPTDICDSSLRTKDSVPGNFQCNDNTICDTADCDPVCDIRLSESGDKLKESSDSELCDTGYTADTEVPSPSLQRKSKGGGHRRKPIESNTQPDKGAESPVHNQCILPSNGATVSLYRIRQGRHLHKALRLTYATTLCAFLCSVLQLYSMFGVYGVLSHKPHPDPWQWLIFKSLFRLSELVMVTCINIILLILGRGHHQYVKRKVKRQKNKPVTDQATVC